MAQKSFGLTTKRIPRDSKLVGLVFKKIKILILACFCLIAATEKVQMLGIIQIIEK